MTNQAVIENVRREIARLIRLCRWSARCLGGAPEEIRRQEESIGTLQDLCDAPGFKAPTNERTGVFVRGVYRVRSVTKRTGSAPLSFPSLEKT